MLRVLLSVAGVLFIGLGVFGGKLLDGLFGVSGNQIESMIKVEVPARSESTSQFAAQVATQSTDDGAQGYSATTIDKQITTETQSVQLAAVAAATQLPELAAAESATAANPDTTESSLADNVTDDGAEPIAPAQAAGDLIAMAEQAKSSIRNEQVSIASTVLASSAATVTVADTPEKSEEVESALVSTAGGVDSGLVVVRDRVNMREGPSIEHPIVLTLDQGQELMEFKRVGRWVHVGAFGTSGKIGWVHERLVGAAN